VRSLEELRALVEDYLAEMPLDGGLDDALRYALAGGGKRIRPVLCLAVAEAEGAPAATALPAAAAVELVHTFSLVHDDLPGLDDDDMRRARPSTHVRFGEGVAILAGDALLAQAFRLALGYARPEIADELVGATLKMIRGQYLDVSGAALAPEELYSLKTGSLFDAATGCALRVAEVPAASWPPWRAFAREFGLLFQVVDDIVDGDGVVQSLGADRAHSLAAEKEARALAALDDVEADTAVLGELLAGLSARAAAR
jgi:geranylgeranyl diphosphate synthase, type II